MYSDEGGYSRENKEITIDVEGSNALYGVITAISVVYLFIALFGIIWFVAGLLGFIASLVCLFYQGSVSDKAIGFLLGLLLGPFYWLFYIYNMNYCTRYTSN
jgi:nucleoside permease NupC